MRSVPRRARSALGLCALLALTACATLVPKLEPPQLAVTSVQLGAGNSSQQQILLMLHVTNPNNRVIAIKGVECDLDLAGMPFAHGESEAAFSLPALGATDVSIDVTANLTNALVIMAASMGHKSLEYHFYGKVHLPGGMLRTIPFDGHGRVRL